ncbi:MAG: hypothetical protein B6D53_01885 [Candidatus Omnitrophica bacterium 4484_49]|nr:MAG: hypothetical protein B6D53_01885 [Candidatus Omnitrophica bacterium 4484_49]
MRKFILLAIFFLLGAFSLSVQTILIREYLISFEGNELAIGIFYASWFFWIALGASLVIWKNKISEYFLSFLLLYPLSAFSEFILFRIFRKLAGIQPWELFLITKALPVSFFVNLPFSLLTGLIFSSGCRFLKTAEEKDAQVVSRAYIWESFGSFISGISITYLIIKLVSPLVVLLSFSGIFLLFSLLAGLNYRRKGISFCAGFLLLFYLFSVSRLNFLERNLNRLRWETIFPQGKIIKELYTPYQHLAIAELNSQRVVLSNGKVLLALGDKISGDQLAALFSSMLDLPQEILLIGYGSENIISSFLQYPIKSLTYLVADKNYIHFIENFLSPEMENVFQDRRVNIYTQDPRVFIQKSDKKFDLIILNLPDPNNSYLNKYYTVEFYKQLKLRLKEKGAIAVRITSAENYIGTEIKNYGSSIYYTLKSCFPKIVIIPGRVNWFFAGRKDSPLTEDPEVLGLRYKRFMPISSSFYPEGFKSLLLRERMEFLKKSYAHNRLFEKFKLVNTDKKPLSYFLNLIVLFRYSNSRVVVFLKSIFISGWVFFLFPLILLFVLRVHFLNFIQNHPEKRLIFSSKLFQFFSGSSAFTFHLILLYLFQNRFGTLFQLIGLVNSIFMLGLFLGSYLARRVINKVEAKKLILMVLSFQLGLYLLSFPLLGKFLPQFSETFCFNFYLFLFLFSGLLTGSSYPLTGKLLEERKVALLNISGSLETLDHWGAGLGAIFSGIILIPLLGIYRSLLFLSFSTSLVLLLAMFDFLGIPKRVREINPQRLSHPYIRSSYILFALSSWVIFSFNYLEKKEEVLSQLELKIAGIDFQKLEYRSQPLPYYLGYKDNKVHYIFRTRELGTSAKGFGGKLDLVIITDREGKIEKVLIESEKESPFHLKLIKSWLKSFEQRYIYKPLEIGENIDVVTSATISSNAVIDGINQTGKKVAILFAEKPQSQIRGPNRKEVFKALTLLSFLVLGIYLFRKGPKLRYRYRWIYLTSLLLVIGVLFKLQLNSSLLLSLFDLNLPDLENLSLVLLIFSPLLLGLFYGRIYCGWFCPFGALQELLAKVRPLTVSQELDRKLRFCKFVLLSIIILLYFVTKNQNIFIQEPLSQFYFPSVALGKILLIAVVFFSLFFPRFWCRYFCPVGAFLSLFNKIAWFKLGWRKNLSCCKYNLKSLRNLECLQCNNCLQNEG